MSRGCPHWKSDILSGFEPRCQESNSKYQSGYEEGAKAERERVIDEAIRAIKVVGMPFGTEAVFVQTLESLRSSPSEQEERK